MCPEADARTRPIDSQSTCVATATREGEPPPTPAPRPGSRPGAGCFPFQRGAMSRRGLHRVTLPRSPRGLTRHARLHLGRDYRRAIKRAAMRDCSRRCVYCAVPLALEVATLDHVHPVARGGAHTPGNLVTACAPCNRLKGDMLPHEVERKSVV